ncbi:MAG TPA: CDP-alcohol phosphatidyltransferase family protein [Patescibacteria group bacterium]|nr:CDP-alcohol phosphatidyltransferase family protein [Patescibacteria group bacterium]
MLTSRVQSVIDRFWQFTLLQVVSRHITPNFFTILRFILILFVVFYLASGQFVWALVMFILAALCDSIDGSLARVRSQISELGLFLDPIADKLLIILTMTMMMYFYPFPALLLTVILFDILFLTVGLLYLATTRDKKTPVSNTWGKGKMVFQVLSVITIFMLLIFNFYWLLITSLVFLLATLFFEFASLFSYGWNAIKIK